MVMTNKLTLKEHVLTLTTNNRTVPSYINCPEDTKDILSRVSSRYSKKTVEMLKESFKSTEYYTSLEEPKPYESHFERSLIDHYNISNELLSKNLEHKQFGPDVPNTLSGRLFYNIFRRIDA